jgi:Mlc titration factor MtfA (ptsG expression regulator)
MRADRPAERWLARGLGAAACAGLVGLGAALGRTEGALVGALAGAGAAVAITHAADRKTRRRREALAEPFPESWRKYLLAAYDHYERLSPPLRERFERDLRLFLLDKRITGVGVEVNDDLRVLVAASAVTLSLGWDDFEWDVLTEVLLYPENFDRDYGFENADLAGQAHPWGTVILSVPALYESFEQADDAFHVGLHEFAHLVDLADDSRMEGIPAGLDEARARQWVAIAEKEMALLRKRGDRSVIDDYGADEPAEFLAVAVEAFFEASQSVRAEHPELYRFLAGYFAQDPAAWDDARGLRP